MMRFVILSATISLLLLSSRARSDTRLAVLPDASESTRKLAAVLEGDLTSLADVQLVERHQLDKVIREQQVSAALGPEAVERRVALGKLVGADLLVFIRLANGGKPHLELTVSESRSGLRLLVEPIGTEQDLQDSEKRASSLVSDAVQKAREKISAIVAVPPFVCDDLSFRFAGEGRVYATVLERSLLQHRGVVVVELAEADALRTELRIAGRGQLDRPAPWYILGRFRDIGTEEKRQVKVRLELKQGDSSAGTLESTSSDGRRLVESLNEMSRRLLGDKLAAQPPHPQDVTVEGRQLYERGRTFLSLSLYSEADELFEASLLLAPSAEAHRDDAIAILEAYTDERSRAEREAGTAWNVQSTAEFRKSRLPVLRRGLSHAEAWVLSKPIRFTSDFGPQRFLSEVPPAEAIESLTRMIRAKTAAGVNDDTFRYVRNTRLREVADRAGRYAGALALANLASKPGDEVTISALFVELDGVHDSPELRSVLEQMSHSSNPFAREAAEKTRTNLANMTRSLAGQRPAAIEPASPPGRRLKAGIRRIDLGEVGSVLSWINAGDRELVVTCLNPGETPARMWELHDGWERRKLANFDWTTAPRFDGRYIWAGGNSEHGPVLEVIEPESDRKWFVQPKDGIPDAPIRRLVFAPLAVGKACVAAEIGEDRSSRSWIGIASFDPATGSKVSILHEARGNPLTDGSLKDSPEAAFSPVGMEILKRANPGPNDPQTVLVLAPGHCLTFVLPPEHPSVRYDRALSFSNVFGTPVVREDKLYWVRKDWREPHPVLLECAAAGQTQPTIVQKNIPDGALAFVGTRVFLAGCDGSLWVSDELGKPFRQLVPSDPRKVFFHQIQLFRSVRHGLLLIANEQLYEFTGEDGKPLVFDRD